MAPTKLVIEYIAAGGSSSNAASVTVSIPSALQALDSGQLASTQTGFSAADIAIRNIFKAGTFTDGAGKYYPADQILSVSAQ
jgi:hypothetical protein